MQGSKETIYIDQETFEAQREPKDPETPPTKVPDL
jgi:hypothetical protein